MHLVEAPCIDDFLRLLLVCSCFKVRMKLQAMLLKSQFGSMDCTILQSNFEQTIQLILGSLNSKNPIRIRLGLCRISG